MSLSLNIQNSRSAKVGVHGLTPEQFSTLKPQVGQALQNLRAARLRGDVGFLDLPFDGAAYLTSQAAAQDFAGAENLLLAGIGGSALGPAAIFGALAHPLHNLLDSAQRNGRPRFFVMDNVDPDFAAAQLEICNPRDSVFNIISKSGATAETAAATLLIFDLLKRALGSGWKDHVLCTTDPASGDLRRLCDAERIPTLNLPSAVGGRFSVLTPVGMFPGFMLGFDVEAMLEGAAAMAERCLSDDFEQNPAAQMAAVLYAMDTELKKPMHVMMAYANSLYLLADWFRQIWAESLGKAQSLTGSDAHCGPTPIKALGTTDQHSQVQLYIEGPFDKCFIFLEAKNFRTKLALPKLYSEVSSLNYLGGQTLNRLMASEFAATREALAREGRPSMTLTFDALDAAHVGEFFMLLEVATALAGSLYNINPYDQPGVELGKVLTYGLMGRKGYADKAKGIDL